MASLESADLSFQDKYSVSFSLLDVFKRLNFDEKNASRNSLRSSSEEEQAKVIRNLFVDLFA